MSTHRIGDPITVALNPADPLVTAGFRRAGERVRICPRCGRLVHPASNSGNWTHYGPDAAVRVSE